MATLLLLSSRCSSPTDVLPALGLLPHRVEAAAASTTDVEDAPPADAVLLDARHDVLEVRPLVRLVRAAGRWVPLLVVVDEDGLAAVSPGWGIAEFLLASAGPAEVDARLRLAVPAGPVTGVAPVLRTGGVVLDADARRATVHGAAMDLTFTEFELLKQLAQHPGRTFTREQLLHQVWGEGFAGGVRAVDFHVKRLRIKLGDADGSTILTVRGAGYRLTAQGASRARTPLRTRPSPS